MAAKRDDSMFQPSVSDLFKQLYPKAVDPGIAAVNYYQVPVLQGKVQDGSAAEIGLSKFESRRSRTLVSLGGFTG